MLTKSNKEEKVYGYSEAIALAGNGCYNLTLLLTLSLALLAMCVDLFSFSVVVSMSSCDFQLNLTQKSILVSIPFMGPVIMAYAWGYISDTRGRRSSLLVAMSVSFLMSSLCAFAPNWIVIAVLKLIGTCFGSCAQSASYTLLGESCSERVKGTYMLIMTSVVHLGCSTYFTLGYFIGNLDFSYDLGFITFVPWRLLVLVLALPLGISALALLGFQESPKFLLNAGREKEALDILRNICRRNGGDVANYPVQNLVLDEVGNLTHKDESLLRSMWEQTAPLFKPPLLWNTLLLYYLIFVVYSSNSGFYVWMPFIAKAFTQSMNTTSSDHDRGLCSIISENTSSSNQTVTCTTSIDAPIVIGFVAYGLTVCILNVCLSKFASRKKALMIAIVLVSAASCLSTKVLPNSISTFFYYGILTSSICMGPISSYYVDLYPTSFRGMAACLGVMMARVSSVAGINLIGPFLMSQCSLTFYSVSALLFSGVLMAFLLPPDRTKKV